MVWFCLRQLYIWKAEYIQEKFYGQSRHLLKQDICIIKKDIQISHKHIKRC